jgi:hypothetical protein
MTSHSNSDPRANRPWVAALLCLICLFIWHGGFITMARFFTTDQIYPHIQEFGLIENTQIGLIAGLILCLVLYTRRADTNMGWMMVFLAGLLLFRELDAHKLYAGESVWKLTFYARFDAPVMVKILAGLFTLSAIGILITIFILQARPFITGLWQGRAVAWVTGSALAGIVLSKLADSFHRTLSFIDLPADYDRWRVVYEESMELTAYTLLLIAVIVAYSGLDNTDDQLQA